MDQGSRRRLAQILKGIQGDRSVREFARDLDVSLGTMQNWLDATGLPSIENLGKIAAVVGMTVQELYDAMNGEQQQTPLPKKAEDVLHIVLQLDDRERRRLIKLLMDHI